MSDKKIQSVDFTGKDELKGAIEGMKRMLEDWPELMQIIAKQRKIAYDSHIAAGFNPDQALELCKSMEL